MLRLLKIFLDIIFLRAGPQDVPVSFFLLKTTMVVYFVSGMLTSLFSFPLLSAMGISLVDTALLISIIWITLRVRHLDNRIPQTITAALGALGIFTMISLPINLWYTIFSYTMEQSTDQFFTLTMLFLLIWNLSVLGHILRHALNITSAVAAGLSLCYLILSLLLTTALFASTSSG